MPLNFEFPKNIWTTIQSPAAALKQIDNMTALLRFDNINKEVQSGRFKGWSKYEADIARNLPIYSNIKKVFDVTNEEYMFIIFNR